MSTHFATVPETFTFASRVDQAPIFVRKWLPPAGSVRVPPVQITHGIAEHSGRYDRFARFLAATGASSCVPPTCVGMAKRPVPTTSGKPD